MRSLARYGSIVKTCCYQIERLYTIRHSAIRKFMNGENIKKYYFSSWTFRYDEGIAEITFTAPNGI